MKTILTLTVVVLCCSFSSAQSCWESKMFCDAGCSNDVACPPTTAGCKISNFTPACTGYYSVDAWTDCAGNFNCDHCMACVQISQGLTLLTCSTTDCESGTGLCCLTCGTVYLSAGTTYQMKVCLSYCPGLDENCDACSEGNCTACACIRYGVITPCCSNE